MTKILYLFFLIVAIVLGAVFQSILFRDEQQQVFFRFLEERITKIQEVILENKFDNRDLIFFGDSVASNVVDPQFFDNQGKWTRSYNFSMPIRELDVNIGLLSWFNQLLEQRADLAQLNVVFDLSFLQIGASTIHHQFISALSTYNTHGLHISDEFDFLNRFMPIITSTKIPYVRTQFTTNDFLRHVANLELLKGKSFFHFEWINFIQMVLVERWGNPKFFDPAWDASRRGHFDFNYEKNRILLDKMLSVASSREAQNAFYNFYKTDICQKLSVSQLADFENLLFQLKITKSKVRNLVVVIAPISPILYDDQKCHSETNIYLKKIRDLGITVFNYSNAIQQDRFFDLLHVNELGAREWTKLLISDLNKSFAP